MDRMSSESSWKQSFLQSTGTESSPSSRQPTTGMITMDETMRDRVSFVNTMVNWTVNDSVIEAKNNLIMMKNEHFRLTQEEDSWRKQHNHSRGNLQEAWDKLVQLRTHISLFRSAIEEATIEDVSSQAAAHAWKSSLEPENPNGSRVPLTIEAAIKLGDVHGIREKIRLKEGLQRKVALIEELLADLRLQLTRHSSELTRVNTLGDPNFSDSVGSSMVLRQAVISISHQLEDAESEYLSSRKELELVEIELSSVLEKARTSGDAIDQERAANDAANAPVSHTEEHLSTLVGAVLQGREPPPALTSLTARIPKSNPSMPPPRCEFSLHEVLSGYARVTRLNGEEPRQYRTRLEKRLGALMILDQQLQDELLAKTEDVRRDRDRLREVEVLRLRVELQISNSENSVRQLESEAMVRQGRSEYLQHLAHNAHTTSPSTDRHALLSSSSMGTMGAYRQLDGQFAVAALSDQPRLTDVYHASTNNTTITTQLPGSMYSPKVDKAALRSSQKSRMEGHGSVSSTHKEYRYPSDLRSASGSSPAGAGGRDGRGDESDDAYARVIAQLSLADGDVASEVNDHTRGTATTVNPSNRASHHQPQQQSATQRSSRSGLATLDEASVSRLQSAAKLLERDLARGHRLQDANLSPNGINTNNNSNNNRINHHHSNYQTTNTNGHGQSRGGDYRDPKPSSPSSSSYNPSSSSSHPHTNNQGNAFSPGTASPSSHLNTSRSPAPFPLVERYDSKTGRRLKDPVRRGYPHQNPPLDYQHHIYDPDMNMEDGTYGGNGYDYSSSAPQPHYGGPPHHSYDTLPEGHLSANLDRPNRIDMYDEHRRQTAFDRRLHEQTQYLHQQGLHLQQQQHKSGRQSRTGVFYGSPEDDDNDVNYGVDTGRPREEEEIDDGIVPSEGGYQGYHDDRVGPVTTRQRARSASPHRFGNTCNRMSSQQQNSSTAQPTRHRAASSDGRRPQGPPSASYANQYNSRAAAAARHQSTRNKHKPQSPNRSATSGGGGAIIAWDDRGGMGLGNGSPSGSPSGQHAGAASIQRLKGIQAKLAEAMNNEIIDPDTGVATDAEGRSLGYVDVNVISARNLPETKKLSASADPYVEMILLPSDDPRVLAVVGNSYGLSLIDAEDAAGGPQYGHQHRHTGATRRGRQRYSTMFDASDASSSAGWCRTSARWSTLFPEWREELRLSLPLREVSQQTLLIRVKDTSKLGESEDELIGQCVVSLQSLLNQQLHKSWISLTPPPDWNPRIRPRYSDSCALRLEMRLFFCRRLLLQHRFDAMVEVLTKSRDQNATGAMQEPSVEDEYPETVSSLNKNRSLHTRGGGHISNANRSIGKGSSSSHRATSSSSSNAAALHRDNGSNKFKTPATQTTPVGAFLTQVIGLQASSFSTNGGASTVMTSSSRRTDATTLAATNNGGMKEGDAMTMAQYQAMLHAAPTSALHNGGKQSKSTTLNSSSRSPPHQRPNHTNTAATTAKTTSTAAGATSTASVPIKAPRKNFKLVGLRERDAMKIYDSEAGEVYKSQLGDRAGFSWVPPKRVEERTPEDSERARRSGGSVVIKKTKYMHDDAVNSSSSSGNGNLRVFDAASYFEQASLNHSHISTNSHGSGGTGGGGRIIQPITGRRRNGVMPNDHGNSVNTSSTAPGGSPERKQRSQLDDSSLIESGTGTSAGTKRSRREVTVSQSLRQPSQAKAQKKVGQTKSKYPTHGGLGSTGNGPVQHSPQK